MKLAFDENLGVLISENYFCVGYSTQARTFYVAKIEADGNFVYIRTDLFSMSHAIKEMIRIEKQEDVE